MKKINITGMLLIIIAFVVVATQLTFHVVNQNLRSDIIKVALVNEDTGLSSEGNKNYASELITLLENDKKATYKSVTRSAAMLGLEKGDYDLLIVFTKDFSVNISNYDTKEPVAALLEFVITDNASRVQYLNSINLTQVISLKLNQAVTEMYTKEVMSTIDEMKTNATENLTLQQNYQQNFTMNVTSPVQNSMLQISNVMTNVNTNSAMVRNFGSHVSRFDYALNGTNEKSIDQINSLTTFSESNIKNLLSLNNIRGFVDFITQQDKSENLNAFDNLQSILFTSEKTLDDIINQMKVDSLNLEVLAVDVQNKRMVEIVYPLDIYNKLKVEIEKEISSNKTYLFDINNIDVSNIPFEDQETYRLLANDIYGQLVANSDSMVAKIFDSEVFSDKLFTEIQVLQPLRIKDSIEAGMLQSCQNMPFNLKSLPAGMSRENYEKTIRFCELSDIQKANTAIPSEDILFTGSTSGNFFLNPNETFDLALISNDFVEATITNLSTNEEIYYTKFDLIPTISNQTDATVNYSVKINLNKMYLYEDGNMIPTIHPQFTPAVFGAVVRTYDENGLAIDTRTINFEINELKTDILISTNQQIALDAYYDIQSSVKLYYGDKLTNVLDLIDLNGFETQRYYSDQEVKIVGIKKFRTIIHPNTSLISRLEKRLDKDGLAREIIVHMLDIYIEEVGAQNDIIEQYLSSVGDITNGSLNIETIYKQDGSLVNITVNDLVNNPSLYNMDAIGTSAEIIRRLSEEQMNTTNTLLTVEKFRQQYETYEQESINAINEINIETSQLEPNLLHTQEFSIQLNNTQKEILGELDQLSIDVNLQLSEIAAILAEMERLESLAGTVTNEVESYQGLVGQSKIVFDDITSQNEDFVKEFVSGYTNSKIGGQENESFFKKFASPIQTKMQNTFKEDNLVIPFFVIFLLSMFALIIAYLVNQIGFKAKAKTELEHVNKTKSIIEAHMIITLASILIGLMVAFVTTSYIKIETKQTVSWIMMITFTMLTLSMLYYFLLLNLKTIGVILISSLMIFYFITNGALGMVLVKSPILSIVQAVNPLGMFELVLLQILNVGKTQLVTVIFIQVVVVLVIVMSNFFIHKNKIQLETTV